MSNWYSVQEILSFHFLRSVSNLYQIIILEYLPMPVNQKNTERGEKQKFPWKIEFFINHGILSEYLWISFKNFQPAWIWNDNSIPGRTEINIMLYYKVVDFSMFLLQ